MFSEKSIVKNTVQKSAKLLGAITLVALATGCKDFKGRIQILKPLDLKVVKGDSTIGVGTNDIKVTFKSSDEVKLEISKAGKDNNPQVIFKLPPHMRLPTFRGPVNIPAEDSGQNYDVVGELDSEVYDGPVVRDYEYCSEQIPYSECTVDAQGRRSCKTKYERVSGRMPVEYYNRETHSRIDLSLIEAASNEVAAQLAAFDQENEKIYLYRGRCLLDRQGPRRR